MTVRDLGAGATPSLRMSGWSARGARTVRDDTEGRLLRRPISHLLGGTLSGFPILTFNISPLPFGEG